MSRPTVDLLDPQFHVGDPHPAYTWMRANEPVYRDVNGIWCVTRMDDVRDVERRPGEFTSSRGYRSTWFPDETSMISEDDPRHHDQRAQIADLFTRRAMVTLEPAIRAIVTDALDHLARRRPHRRLRGRRRRRGADPGRSHLPPPRLAP